jgi:hypothetical protein
MGNDHREIGPVWFPAHLLWRSSGGEGRGEEAVLPSASQIDGSTRPGMAFIRNPHDIADWKLFVNE